MRIGKAGAFRHRLRTYVESVSDIFNRVMSLAEVFMKRKAILFLIVLTALALTGIVTACSLHEHTLERVKAVAPTCDMDGNSEYWRCTGCGKLFKDESASVEIADESSFSIAAKGHDLIQVEENPATCTNNGTRSYWICRTCGKMFGDAEGEHGLSEEDIVLTASGHFLYNHPAVAETCTEDGNIEYWTCNYCGKIFIDADATQQADGIEDVRHLKSSVRYLCNGYAVIRRGNYHVGHFDVVSRKRYFVRSVDELESETRCIRPFVTADLTNAVRVARMLFRNIFFSA